MAAPSRNPQGLNGLFFFIELLQQQNRFFKQIEMEINYLEDDQFKNEAQFQRLQEAELVSSFIKFNKHNFNKLKNIQQQKMVHLRKKKNPLELKELVTKAKVDILKKNFVRKIKRGKVYKQVPHELLVEEQDKRANFLGRMMQFLEQTEGLDLSPIMLCVWSFINIIQISVMVIIFSIQIAFPETEELQVFLGARIFSITLYVIDMVLNFVTQRQEMTGSKKNLKEIGEFYVRNGFVSDFFSIAIFPLSYGFEANTIRPVVMAIALLKLKNNLKRFQSYEFIYVKTNSRQQYYGLIKVFILNFTIGHVLSILLNLMATLSTEGQNWYSKVNIQNENWETKYIWGYYWGANIMLTVGFGDISASNTVEAVTLIFIETISCITLAYNISCVGSIIGEIKAENEEKKKKLKYFHRMCEDNKISEELQTKINNFIEESYLIKSEFELEEYEEVINSLPKTMQSEYRKEANQSLFDVGFFNSPNKKTILNLAESVIRKIAHPEEILQKKGEITNFCILQKGSLGFTCRKGPKSLLNGMVIQKFDVGKNDQPKILSLGFVKRKILSFDIKSLYYSVYYYLTHEDLMKSLGICEMDYHFFLFMKDKDDSILGSNEIYKCKICKDDYHTLFQCPKYHFIPMKEVVLANHLKKQTIQKVPRNQIQIERCYRDFRTLFHLKGLEQGQEKYLMENFDEDEIQQIKNIKKYYYRKNFQSESSSENLFKELRRRKDSFEQQFQKIQDILTKVALNTIEFWGLQSDVAHNFKYYFKEYNPNRLIQFKTNLSRKKAKDMIFGSFAFKKPNNYPYQSNNQTVSASFLSGIDRFQRQDEEQTQEK